MLPEVVAIAPLLPAHHHRATEAAIHHQIAEQAEALLRIARQVAVLQAVHQEARIHRAVAVAAEAVEAHTPVVEEAVVVRAVEEDKFILIKSPIIVIKI